ATHRRWARHYPWARRRPVLPRGVDPMRRTAMIAALALCAGCFRLSDPVYTFMPLRPDPPPTEGWSILYGTIEMPSTLLAIFDRVQLRQIGPEDKREYWHVTENALFRVFDNRPLKSNSFVFVIAPGVYELDRIESSWQRIIWTLSDESRVHSRIYIT